MAKKTKKTKKKKRAKKILKKSKKVRRSAKRNPPSLQLRRARKDKKSLRRSTKAKRKPRRKKPEITQAVHPVRDYKRKKKRQRKQISNGVHQPKIRVIGIGGGGGSIINEIAPAMKKIGFVAVNTDIQALKKLSKKTRRFSFGKNLTQGLGTGMNPKLGELAAQSESDKIKSLIEGQDLCIFVSCLGGGTGSGATPLFAKTARELNVLSYGIFTLPFKFEGGKKMKVARSALNVLESDLNAISIIPNQRIFQIIDQKTPLRKALSALNKILSENLKGLIEFIYWPGLINIDFADLRAILEGRGKRAYLNSAKSQGKNKVEESVEKVLNSPLYRYGVFGADRILFNIEGGKDLKMSEVEQISKRIYSFNPRAKIIFGVAQYPRYKNKLKITLLFTTPGQKKEKKPKKKPLVKPKLKKELIEEKLDLSLEKIKKLTGKKKTKKKPPSPRRARLRRPRKKAIIKKVKPKTEKKTKTQKKSKIKKKLISSRESKKLVKKKKQIKTIKKTKKIVRKKTLSKKKSLSPTRPPARQGLRRPRKKIAIKTVKKKEPVKPEALLPGFSSYTEKPLTETQAERIRKNALDLKREAEEVEKEMEKKERKWDIPAFLRRKK